MGCIEDLERRFGICEDLFGGLPQENHRALVLREGDLAGLALVDDRLCGIDEVGRGPLAGPVCAGAVILPDDFPFAMLDDSKAMSPKKRDMAYEKITALAVDWAAGWATCDEIGALNILHASLLAMKRAYDALAVRPRIVLADGDKAPLVQCPVFPVVKGDGLIPAIMAASIVAKVARDRVMERLDAVEPQYGFSRHKGYPTEQHRKAIKEYGVSLWARPGFRTA